MDRVRVLEYQVSTPSGQLLERVRVLEHQASTPSGQLLERVRVLDQASTQQGQLLDTSILPPPHYTLLILLVHLIYPEKFWRTGSVRQNFS